MSHQDAVTKITKRLLKSLLQQKNSKLTIIENKKKKFMVYNFIQKLHIQKMENKFLKIFCF